MNFLAPLFMLGAAAVAGPIIFHLIRSSTRERMPFSSLMFLQPAPPRLSQRRKISNWLLLALRCLALALLAFGFARPFWPQAQASGGNVAPVKRSVILVDVSASMRRNGLWAQAQARAASVLRSASPNDQIAVFTFGRSVRALVSMEEWQAAPAAERVALAESRLAAITPGWENTQIDAALIRAAEILADNAALKTSGPRSVVLISDLQEGSQLSALQSYEWPKGVQLQLETVDAGRTTNTGLQRVGEAADTDQQSAAVVRVRVTNASNATREQFQVGWVREPDGSFAGAPLNVYLAAGQSRVVSVPVPLGQTSLHRIVLRGDDDDFDDTVYVVPPEQQRTSAIYFGGEKAEDSTQPLYFLERAVPNTSRYSVKLIHSSGNATVSPQDMQAAKLYFVSDVLSTELVGALRTEARGGKTVLFAPKNASAAPTLAALLELPQVAMTEAHPASYAMLAEINYQHPLFAAFSDPRFSDFTKIHVWNYRRMETAAIPDARVVAKFDNGDPALLEIPVGQGRVLVLLTGWNPADSQLAVSSKFVPLIYALIEQSGGIVEGSAAYSVGDEIPWPTENGGTMRQPDGAIVSQTLAQTKFLETTAPGIYELTANGHTSRIAVNLSPNESRTAPLPADELERFGAPAAVTSGELATPVNEAFLEGAALENRQKLWRWFIVAALGVLLIETLLAGWTSRRSVVAGGTPP